MGQPTPIPGGRGHFGWRGGHRPTPIPGTGAWCPHSRWEGHGLTPIPGLGALGPHSGWRGSWADPHSRYGGQPVTSPTRNGATRNPFFGTWVSPMTPPPTRNGSTRTPRTWIGCGHEALTWNRGTRTLYLEWESAHDRSPPPGMGAPEPLYLNWGWSLADPHSR